MIRPLAKNMLLYFRYNIVSKGGFFYERIYAF